MLQIDIEEVQEMIEEDTCKKKWLKKRQLRKQLLKKPS
jgi:hypothetical protein